MSDDKKHDADKPGPGEQQSDTTTEANKPDEARAKGDPKAGNILGGVQPGS